eukprot:gene16723-11966_t
MVLIAALEATGRQVRTYQGHYVDCLISSALGGGFVGIYGSAVIFHPNPWWSPAVLIPTSGMVIGFSVSGPAIAVERLLSEVADKRHEAETRLAFGATDYESVLGIVKSSISAALLPTMNQMAIMGLVSIPGMMTGQLIGGTSPAVAAEYQMAILYLLVTTATISSTTSVLLAVRHAVFDREHRLTPDKLIKSGKVEIDVAIYRVVSQLGQFIWKYLIRWRVVYAPLSDASQHQLEMTRTSGGISDEENGDETVVALNEHAWPFFAAHQANVKSGSGKLFVSSYSTQMSGLSFRLMPGERITLEGPSGIGKTRLLRALAELDPLYEGHASFLGHSTKKLQPSTDYVKNHDWYRDVSARGSPGLQLVTVPEWRARVIYVPQALPPLAGTPLSLIKESCGFRSRRESPGAKAICDDVTAQCERLEISLGLRAGLLSATWVSLSGGERQRAAIACALVLATSLLPWHTQSTGEGVSSSAAQYQKESLQHPDSILLLDEPTAACDAETTSLVEKALVASGAAMILITHDDRQAQRIAHRRLILHPSGTVASDDSQ